MSWLQSDEKEAARTKKMQYQEELKEQMRQNEEACVDRARDRQTGAGPPTQAGYRYDLQCAVGWRGEGADD